MEVINARQRLLTNVEVLQLVREVRAGQAEVPKTQRLKMLNTILYEVGNGMEGSE